MRFGKGVGGRVNPPPVLKGIDVCKIMNLDGLNGMNGNGMKVKIEGLNGMNGITVDN